MTLVEILLAGFMLTVLMIPISQLIFGGTTKTKVTQDRAAAAAEAANIMGALLEKVPYTAIEPGAGPNALDIMLSDVEEQGLYSGRQQAALNDDWERVLDDTPGDDERIIVRNGTRFEVILFAGAYEDVDTRTGGRNQPDINAELTFSYFRNPWSPPDEDTRNLVTLPDGHAKNPYDATGDSADGVDDADVHDPRYRAGWPESSETDPVTNRQTVNVGNFGTTPGRRWPRHSLDLSDFRERSAFMKLVLGLRWHSGMRSDGTIRGAQGSGNSKTSKEFWLVSFKAKLEEN